MASLQRTEVRFRHSGRPGNVPTLRLRSGCEFPRGSVTIPLRPDACHRLPARNTASLPLREVGYQFVTAFLPW